LTDFIVASHTYSSNVMMRFVSSLLLLSALSVQPQTIVFTSGRPNTGIFISKADGREERALIAPPGLNYNATWSPDGQWIVFTSERNSSADLYRIKIDGSGLEQLTDSPAYDDQAAFSPDGQQLAFVTSRVDGTADLWIMDLHTRRAKALTSGPGGDFRPAWSSDGQWIAFSSDRGSTLPKRKGGWEHLQLADIYIIHPDGSGIRQLTPHGGFCGSPKWAPDNKRLVAYCMSAEETFTYRQPQAQIQSGETQLISIDPVTGDREVLKTGPGVKMTPTILPSGEIAYARKDNRAPGIFYADGRPGPSGNVRSPSWSPDGTEVVYYRILTAASSFWEKAWSRSPDFELIRTRVLPAFDPSGDHFIAEAPAGESESRALVLFDSGRDNPARPFFQPKGRHALAAQWSPLGDAVIFGLGAFNAFTAGGDFSAGRVDGGAQVAIVNANGSGFHEVTSGANNNGFPSFAPDNHRFVYRTFGPEGQGLRIKDLNTSNVTVVTTAYDNFPHWSPRGDRIVFVRQYEGDYEIYTVRPDGKDVRRLTSSPGNDAHPTWSPDGKSIVFSSSRTGFKDEAPYSDVPQPYGELFVMRYDGTHVQQLTDNQWEDGGAAWQPKPSR
jgi:Tol biopolymer transport system component